MKKHLSVRKEGSILKSDNAKRPVENIVGGESGSLNGSSISFVKKGRSRLAKLLGLRGGEVSIEREVADLIEEHDPEGKQVGSEERNMLHNVFGLSDTCVNDVMVPRTDIVAIDLGITLDALKEVIIENGHTRIPVYKDLLDNVVGFIHIKDLVLHLGMGERKHFSIQSILREILYVPPSMKVMDLLLKMQAKRVHMAVVLDEYGGTDGLVTMEDLVEEIIGDVEDEHDSAEVTQIRRIDDFSFEVEARMPVEDLEDKLNVKLVDGDESEDFDTIGGLLFYLLGRVPATGEIIKHKSGVEFEIIDADARKILTVLVRKAPVFDV